MISVYVFNMGIKFLFASDECDHPQVLLNSRKTVFSSEYLKEILFLHQVETKQTKSQSILASDKGYTLSFPSFPFISKGSGK